MRPVVLLLALAACGDGAAGPAADAGAPTLEGRWVIEVDADPCDPARTFDLTITSDTVVVEGEQGESTLTVSEIPGETAGRVVTNAEDGFYYLYVEDFGDSAAASFDYAEGGCSVEDAEADVVERERT